MDAIEKVLIVVALSLSAMAGAALIFALGMTTACRGLEHRASAAGKTEIVAFIKTSEVCK